MVKQRYRRISIAVRNQMNKFIRIVAVRFDELMCVCVSVCGTRIETNTNWPSTQEKSYTLIVLALHAYFKHTNARTISNDVCVEFFFLRHQKNKWMNTNWKKNCDKFNEFQRSVFFCVVVFFLHAHLEWYFEGYNTFTFANTN